MWFQNHFDSTYLIGLVLMSFKLIFIFGNSLVLIFLLVDMNFDNGKIHSRTLVFAASNMITGSSELCFYFHNQSY